MPKFLLSSALVAAVPVVDAREGDADVSVSLSVDGG